MSLPPEHLEILRANGSKPVRLTADGRIFIGDDEFLYPVAKDSIKVERVRNGKHTRHALTLTLYVGDVIMERPTTVVETRHCREFECGRDLTLFRESHDELDAAFAAKGWVGNWCSLHSGRGD